MTAPATERPELYEQLVAVIDALVRSADVSGARLGDLPQVDLTHVDPKVLEVLPQRDLVREISSKVKLHQGATTVMTSALRDLKLSQTVLSCLQDQCSGVTLSNYVDDGVLKVLKDFGVVMKKEAE